MVWFVGKVNWHHVWLIVTCTSEPAKAGTGEHFRTLLRCHVIDQHSRSPIAPTARSEMIRSRLGTFGCWRAHDRMTRRLCGVVFGTDRDISAPISSGHRALSVQRCASGGNVGERLQFPQLGVGTDDDKRVACANEPFVS